MLSGWPDDGMARLKQALIDAVADKTEELEFNEVLVPPSTVAYRSRIKYSNIFNHNGWGYLDTLKHVKYVYKQGFHITDVEAFLREYADV